MPTPLDTTFTVGGITLGAFPFVDSDGVEWQGDAVDGWYNSPGRRLQQANRPVADGVYDSQDYSESRVIALEGLVSAPTRALSDAANDKFNALLTSGVLETLTVTEPSWTRQCAVKRAATKPQVNRVNNLEWVYQLQLVAPDPRKYSAALKTASTPLASPAPGGVQWNGSAGSTGVQWNGPAGSTGVVWQSAGGSTGVMTLSNAWSAHTPILFVINGPVTNPRLTNLTSQQVLWWGGTVDTGQTLTIDTGSGAVRLGPTGMPGQNRKSQMVRTDFFKLGPSETVDVIFQADTFTASEASAQWRDAAM
ncbi:hypothetical protein DMH04_41285 [Kibdelosporangium aridum]|uniref:Phage tail protein n=1 Tax=Kibdelosporangium aridum TaxID=2030 RepID=A0A428YUR2_KIBAR|nr:phage tail domain-containing protein [Kibdelosporangium aridum]RSM73448.1 hypothetical protein DMH04_41285 [Kibdelosporangium aridum]